MVGFDADLLCFFLQLRIFDRRLESNAQGLDAISRNIGRDEIRAAERRLAEIEIEHGALLVRLGEVGDLRYALRVEISCACRVCLHQHTHAPRFAAFEPARIGD